MSPAEKNAVYTVSEVKREHYRKIGKAKVLRDEIIELEYHPEREDGKQDLKTKLTMRLRKVSYQDEQNRYYDFLTNNFDTDSNRHQQKMSHSSTRKDGELKYCSKK